MATSIVTLYDITGLATWLTQTVLDPASPTDIFVSSNAPVVSTLGINLLVGPQSLVNSLPAQGWDQAIGNTDGTVFDFDLSKTETFLADPSKTYGISIRTSSVAGGLNPIGSFSDFFNTSTFSFTNLNGATFVSGSGAFLTAAASEPSVLALLGIGMIGLMVHRRSRS
ncbi:MAG: PEP-CTERM sorting domain-containing protein [Nitrosomonas sp.]|nr:PEP-CTERM sorting domain-containing protein [Nitrosomonas sp.]MCW5608922.1 PEP-CTERM sorting domain-containing protein [Nitrosomonas sp.]